MESCYTTRKMLQQKLGVGDWLHGMMTFPRDRWSCAMLLRSYGRTCFFWGWTFESKRTTYRSLWSRDFFQRMKLPKGLPGWVVAELFLRIFPSMCSLFLEDFCLEQTARETAKGSTWSWSMEHTKTPPAVDRLVWSHYICQERLLMSHWSRMKCFNYAPISMTVCLWMFRILHISWIWPRPSKQWQIKPNRDPLKINVDI